MPLDVLKCHFKIPYLVLQHPSMVSLFEGTIESQPLDSRTRPGRAPILSLG